MKKIFVCILFILCFSYVYAQESEIRGNLTVKGTVYAEELLQGGEGVLTTEDTVDIATIAPTITTYAGDTTGVTPGKAGDIFINTSGSKVYIAKSSLRGGWMIINTLWFLLLIRTRHSKKIS